MCSWVFSGAGGCVLLSVLWLSWGVGCLTQMTLPFLTCFCTLRLSPIFVSPSSPSVHTAFHSVVLGDTYNIPLDPRGKRQHSQPHPPPWVRFPGDRGTGTDSAPIGEWGSAGKCVPSGCSGLSEHPARPLSVSELIQAAPCCLQHPEDTLQASPALSLPTWPSTLYRLHVPSIQLGPVEQAVGGGAGWPREPILTLLLPNGVDGPCRDYRARRASHSCPASLPGDHGLPVTIEGLARIPKVSRGTRPAASRQPCSQHLLGPSPPSLSCSLG